MNKSTQDCFNIAYYIDEVKNKIFNTKLSKDKIYKALSSNIDSTVLYYVFLNISKEQAFEMDLATITEIMSKYGNVDNMEKIKAMTSILSTDKVFTDMFAFNGMVEAFNDLNITMGSIEPYAFEEVYWTCLNIMGIFGASNFPFKNDAFKYIQACILEESLEYPIPYANIPIIDGLFGQSRIEKLDSLSLFEFASLDVNKLANIIGKEHASLFNNILHFIHGAKYIVTKHHKQLKDYQDIFGI